MSRREPVARLPTEPLQESATNMPDLPAQPPQVLSTRSQAYRNVRAAQSAGQSVGVVMTMGALHAGHLSLAEASAQACDRTLVTIFVNPTQFLPGEDFERYPRQLEADMRALAAHPVDWIFAPSPSEMYGPHHSTFVQPPQVGQRWEGEMRPGHFRGVCTVVLKLLQTIPADFAFFGQKDYQQYLVLRHMAQELDVATEIRVCPTVREPDGLAMSSRNQYLSPAERHRAASISRGLFAARDLVQQGIQDVATVKNVILGSLAEADVTQIDYVALVHPDSLEEVTVVADACHALVAVRVGATRLIDNLRLTSSPQDA